MLVHREYVGIQMAGLSAPVTSMKFTEVDTVKETPVTFSQGRFEKNLVSVAQGTRSWLDLCPGML